MNFTPYQISNQVVRAFARACAIGLRSGKQLDLSKPLFIDLARSIDPFPSVLILHTLNIPLSQLQYTLCEEPTMTGYYKQIQSIIDQSQYTMPSAELVRYYHDQLKSILEGSWKIFPNHEDFPVIDAPRIVAYMLHEGQPDIYPWPYITSRPAKEDILASYVQNSLEHSAKATSVEVQTIASAEAEEQMLQTILSTAMMGMPDALSEEMRQELNIASWQESFERTFRTCPHQTIPRRRSLLATLSLMAL